MGIQNCVHRLQNYFVSLEMIEGYSFVSTGFWCKFFFSFFCFLVVNCFLFLILIKIFIFNLIILYFILNYFLCLFLIIIFFNLIIFYFILNYCYFYF